MALFDYDQLEAPAAGPLARRYRLAEPFPHVVFENFVLADPKEVADAFPSTDWEGWSDRSSNFQPGKSSCRSIEDMPPLLRRMVHELCEPRFLRDLSDLLGIPGLLPDPFLEGGGLQWTGPGGKLLPHTDFHHHPTLPLYRRANILVFLNPDWRPGDGGELGLFEMGENDPAVLVPPRYGTCVIFTTDHRSVHGVAPIGERAAQRRSIALYYYSVEAPDVFSGDRKTWWYDPAKVSESTASEKLRLAVMKSALRASKAFMRLAYRVDPQQPDLVGRARDDT